MQFRPGDADLVVALQCLVQLVEPARLHLGVVVQKHDVVAARCLETAIAGAHETQIGAVAHQPDATTEDEVGEQRLVARAIVDDDDLVRDFRAVLLDRLKFPF
jgi:hypothetical protein